MRDGKIQSFTDLNVWKEGHRLVIMIYKITKGFPKEETYCLVDQMRRATTSIKRATHSLIRNHQSLIDTEI